MFFNGKISFFCPKDLSLAALFIVKNKEKFAKEIGIKFLKIAMPWPLEETIIEKFSEGLEKIIVVEEKRSIIETQIKEILFNKNKKIIRKNNSPVYK